MKYEMIFGDERLFDGAPDDAEAVGGGKPHHGAVVFYKFSNGEFQYKYKEEGEDWKVSTCENPQSVIKAMRRIIAEPKCWTREDKKACRLPEVGAEVQFNFYQSAVMRQGVIKYIDDQVAVIQTEDVTRPFCYETCKVVFKPIETPEEKAERLEDEWVDAAYGNTYVFACVSKDEKNRLKEHMRSIYKAQISGDLPAPGKE